VVRQSKATKDASGQSIFTISTESVALYDKIWSGQQPRSGQLLYGTNSNPIPNCY